MTGEGATTGDRQLPVWLRRAHQLRINTKTGSRLMQAAGLLQGGRWPQWPPALPCRIARHPVITGAHPLGERDLKYGYVAGTARYVYLGSVIDVYDRSRLADHLGWTGMAAEAAPALRQVGARAPDRSRGLLKSSSTPNNVVPAVPQRSCPINGG